MNETDGVSAEVWTQDGPIGASSDGFPEPDIMTAVAVAGVVQTRETPSLLAITGALTAVTQGQTFHLIGASPQRRRVLVASTVDIVVNVDRGSAQQGLGLRIAANTAPVELRAAVDIHVNVTGAGPGTVSWWAEVDPG